MFVIIHHTDSEIMIKQVTFRHLNAEICALYGSINPQILPASVHRTVLNIFKFTTR